MQSIPKAFREQSRKLSNSELVQETLNSLARRPIGTVRRHGDKPNGGNRGRLRLTSVRARESQVAQ